MCVDVHRRPSSIVVKNRRSKTCPTAALVCSTAAARGIATKVVALETTTTIATSTVIRAGKGVNWALENRQGQKVHPRLPASPRGAKAWAPARV